MRVDKTRQQALRITRVQQVAADDQAKHPATRDPLRPAAAAAALGSAAAVSGTPGV